MMLFVERTVGPIVGMHVGVLGLVAAWHQQMAGLFHKTVWSTSTNDCKLLAYYPLPASEPLFTRVRVRVGHMSRIAVELGAC